jgi:hypothetical protein
MYYVMDCRTLFPPTSLGKYPNLPSGPWFTGRPIDPPRTLPLEYALDPDYPGKLRPFYPAAAPLMREDLLAALAEAGVDNLQAFAALLHDPAAGTTHTNYKAVNIIGIVAAADMGQSVMMGTSDSTLIDADFESLVIDDAKPRGALLFRLAESASAIVVHDTVKQMIEARVVPGMVFYGPGEWAG